jgi:hypothetical protein
MADLITWLHDASQLHPGTYPVRWRWFQGTDTPGPGGKYYLGIYSGWNSDGTANLNGAPKSATIHNCNVDSIGGHSQTLNYIYATLTYATGSCYTPQ